MDNKLQRNKKVPADLIGFVMLIHLYDAVFVALPVLYENTMTSDKTVNDRTTH